MTTTTTPQIKTHDAFKEIIKAHLTNEQVYGSNKEYEQVLNCAEEFLLELNSRYPNLRSPTVIAPEHSYTITFTWELKTKTMYIDFTKYDEAEFRYLDHKRPQNSYNIIFNAKTKNYNILRFIYRRLNNKENLLFK